MRIIINSNEDIKFPWNILCCIKISPNVSPLDVSLPNPRRRLANAEVIADVKSKIIVSLRHIFADVIFSATSTKFKTIKIKLEKNIYTQANTCLLHI